MSDETQVTEAEATETGHHHHHDHDHDHDHFEFVEEPTFEVDYKGDCAYEVKVVVPAANKQKQAEELYDELKSEVELPGFRRGRAPIKLVEKKFAKAVKGEVTGKLVSAAFEKLIEREELRPIGTPDIDGLDDETDKPDDAALDFVLKFEVAPRVELGKYRGVDVERPIVKIDDKDVDESVDRMRESHAVFEALNKNGKAKEGDQVIIDFKGEIDGEAFSGGSAENYPYVVGSGRFFKEFEEVLNGAKAGTDLACKVTFPDDYFAEDLRGKTADFTITVHEVKRKKLPDVDEDFAKTAGYESVDELRAKIKAELDEVSAQRSKQITESRALEAVVEASTFEIPKSLIESVAAQNRQEQIQRLVQMRAKPAQIEEMIATIDAEAEEGAIRAIKSTTVLHEIGDVEGVEVTEEDFEKEAETLSRSIGASAEMVAQFMASAEQRSGYEDRIFRSKALAVIIEHANITDKELTRDELEAAEEALEGGTESVDKAEES